MPNYTKPVKFSSTGNYGVNPEGEDDVYTIKQFRDFCIFGHFVDYDGFGNPVKNKLADTSICITPSHLEQIPPDATHIIWYNR